MENVFNVFNPVGEFVLLSDLFLLFYTFVIFGSYTAVLGHKAISNLFGI